MTRIAALLLAAALLAPAPSLAVGDLHPGEFVTVAAERHGTKLVAVSVTVVEPHSK